MKKITYLLIAGGDCLVLLILTLVGFASHQELTTAGWRIMTTFIPLVIAWFFVAPLLGSFRKDTITTYRSIWRPAVAIILAAPIAALLRGFWLARPIIPIFPLVLAATGVVAILIWRSLLFVFIKNHM